MITWKRSVHGSGWDGLIEVGNEKLRLGSISYGLTRNDPKPWKLQTTIPGWTNARGYETEAEAKAGARRILSRFVKLATTALEAESDGE